MPRWPVSRMYNPTQSENIKCRHLNSRFKKITFLYKHVLQEKHCEEWFADLLIWSLFYSLFPSVCSTLATQFLKNVSPLMGTAANYYLRAAFFSDLEKKAIFKPLPWGQLVFLKQDTHVYRWLPTPIQIHVRVYVILQPYFSWQSRLEPTHGNCYQTTVCGTRHTNTLNQDGIKSNCRASTYTLYKNSI